MHVLQTLIFSLGMEISSVSALPGPLSLVSAFSRISTELDSLSLGNCSYPHAVLPLNSTSVQLPNPSSGLTLKHIAIGRGTQNYTCENSTSAAVPVSIGAAATLFDASCVAAKSMNLLHEMPAVIGSSPLGSLAFLAELLSHTTNSSNLILGEHYFNTAGVPVLDLRLSGLSDWIVAAKTASVDAPQYSSTADQNVAWLQLDRLYGSGIEEVYRVETYQGSAPATCSGLNKTVIVQYAAEYWFYG
ncbi:uncharacterized protein N7483_009838 [Penicillium malachiteum]|uniref:uncharacterized protein n=1 Tax=Penicillium malachiteum TaxID=1324776 RepID=UPI0025468E10|nr:uncharacterized protein N7483_009838 [Penicillium malachiteum]KAJ5721904.1 hypothetical protein N7483_009838 [Penicillium malachiteum]